MEPLLFQDHYFLHRDQFEIISGHQPENALFIIEQGAFDCSFFGNPPVRVVPGDFVFFPRRYNFVRNVVEPIDFHLIYFSLNDEDSLSKLLPVGLISCIDHKRRESNLQLIRNLLNRFDDFSYRTMQHVLNDIFFQYLHEFSAGKALYTDDNTKPYVQQAIDYYDTHYAEPISLQRLVQEFHTSPSSLNRMFKNETGLSPIEYLIKLRIRKARHMLLFTNDTIAEIAEQCGYENTAYFSNAFKKNCGLSPTEYRKSISSI